jgi:hypothetical protein
MGEIGRAALLFVSTPKLSSAHMHSPLGRRNRAMSLRFVLLISWSLPALLLGWILYHQYGVEAAPVVETNAKMRTKMCREHIDTAKADPNDTVARQALEECVAAGYTSTREIKLARE